jgi:predicted esterase
MDKSGERAYLECVMRRAGAFLSCALTAATPLLASIAWVQCAQPPPRTAQHQPDNLSRPTPAIAVSPAAARPAVPGGGAADIPKLSAIRIDGQSDDWRDQGLWLDVLAALPAGDRDSAAFDARARVGWDERGLLVLCEVSDATPWEASSTRPVWSGDSVELFVADAVGGRNAVQFVVAPGMTSGHPDLRQESIDHRTDAALKGTPLSASFARARSARGYDLEALIPWPLLGIVPKPGRPLGFQIYVNDHGGGTDTRLVWYPADRAHMDTKQMQPVRLADHAGPPVTLAAAARVHSTRAVTLAMASSAPPGDLRVLDGDREVARPTLEKHGRLWIGSLELPVSFEATRFGPVQVASSAGAVAVVEIPDLAAQREQLLDELSVVAESSIFDGPTFPVIRFEQPRRADEVLGRATIHVAFYDSEHEAVITADKPGRYGAVIDVVPEAGTTFRRRMTLFRLPDKVRWRDARVEAELHLPAELGIAPEVLRKHQRDIGDWFKSAVTDAARHGDLPAVELAHLYESRAEGPTDSSHTNAWSVNTRWWHEQRRRDGDLDPYRYIVHLPAGAAADPAKRWPTIVFLHGSGERGRDLSMIASWGPLGAAEAAEQRDASFPFIVIAPQCPPNEWWSTPWMEDLLAEVESKYPVDRDRLYLTGLSMGGFGTWAMSAEHPDWFAAAAPICGGGDVADARALANLPIWVFHGAKDDVVSPERSQEMVRALRAQNGRVRFTLYPEAKHDSWTQAYQDDALYAWFLEQRRGLPKQPRVR